MEHGEAKTPFNCNINTQSTDIAKAQHDDNIDNYQDYEMQRLQVLTSHISSDQNMRHYASNKFVNVRSITPSIENAGFSCSVGVQTQT